MEVIKRIVITAELCFFLALVVLTAVFGFNKGVWDGERFYKAGSDGDKMIYESKNASSVEVVTGEVQNKLIIRTADGSAAQLNYEVSSAREPKTVTLFAHDGSVLLNDRYYSNTKKWSVTKNSDSTISEYFSSTEGVRIGLFDKGLLDMALGNAQTRLSGRIGFTVYAVLAMAFGFAINFAKRLVEKLDRFFTGFFYDNAKGLRMNELGELFLILIGIAIFVMGALLLIKGVLF
ncbi:MAG: hypothetical protein IKZ82_02160 [Clostridia bacterium]|nr:hypothetical protein [Clostridia bacterium]